MLYFVFLQTINQQITFDNIGLPTDGTVTLAHNMILST